LLSSLADQTTPPSPLSFLLQERAERNKKNPKPKLATPNATTTSKDKPFGKDHRFVDDTQKLAKAANGWVGFFQDKLRESVGDACKHISLQNNVSLQAQPKSTSAATNLRSPSSSTITGAQHVHHKALSHKNPHHTGRRLLCNLDKVLCNLEGKFFVCNLERKFFLLKS
jgi:hypothetical protein